MGEVIYVCTYRDGELLKSVMCARNVGDGHLGRLDFNVHTHFSEIEIMLQLDLKLDERGQGPHIILYMLSN